MEISNNRISAVTGEQLTLLPEDSLASHTAQQENGSEKRMSAICGQKCLEQYGKFSRAGLWGKTFAALLIGMEGWSSTRCRLTWKLKVTKCYRFYFQLRVLEPRTGGTAFGLLHTPQGLFPTPTAMMPGDVDMDKLDARRMECKARKKNGNGFGPSLNELAKKGLLPSPAARDFRSGFDPLSGKMESRMEHSRGVNLHEFIQRHHGDNFQLNPAFMEEMMGFPIGWTALNPSETPSSPR
jgi:hypothetical protein